jgi:hypothetical protein
MRYGHNATHYREDAAMLRNRIAFLFLNLGHLYDHMLMALALCAVGIVATILLPMQDRAFNEPLPAVSD